MDVPALIEEAIPQEEGQLESTDSGAILFLGLHRAKKRPTAECEDKKEWNGLNQNHLRKRKTKTCLGGRSLGKKRGKNGADGQGRNRFNRGLDNDRKTVRYAPNKNA